MRHRLMRHTFLLIGIIFVIPLVSCVGRLAPYTQSSWTYEPAGKPAPDTQWLQTYGEAGISTYGSLAQQTSDGGYIIWGHKPLAPYCLIKTDLDGNQLWERSFDDDEIVRFELGQQTTDGGYIICGMYDGKGAYLLKTDTDGNTICDKKMGEYVRAYSVQQTTDGGYIMGVVFRNNHNVGLIKTDADGNKLWDRTFDITDFTDLSYGYFVQQTKDGGYIIAGNISGKTVGPTNDDIMWLIKTDVEGDQLWYKVYKLGYGWSAQETMDGGYIMCGVTYIHGRSSILLTKTDIDGNELWSKIFNYIHPALEKAVQQTVDGGYILCGYRDDWSGESWLIKTDAAGNRLWDKKFGSRKNEVTGYCVQQTTDGGYILSGSIEHPPKDYNKPYIKTYNILLLKIAPLP